MSEALYRKYRPITFKDVVGQEHIERTLRNAIEQDKVSHAYLFCGPRGTGKTTTARILAKALLCEKGPTIDPDGTCPECLAIASGTHPDVYELDAASRTGVENVREEIISRVNYAPTRGAYKVYIIDEVHMLSSAAFNALLKTLEEPPQHVVFILCTTDPQKVPETIQSRCQRFDFHRISVESIVTRLGAICVAEGVTFDGEALDLIAHRADGGMRNALTTLEQLIAFGEGSVTLESAQNFLGALDDSDLTEIVNAIGKRDAAACFTWVAQYVETGADLAQFVRDLSEYMRNLYLMSMAGADVEIAVSDSTRSAMTSELSYFGQDRLNRILVILGDVMKELRTSSNPRLTFEIALARMVRPESDITIASLAERVEALEQLVKALSTNQASPISHAHSSQEVVSSPSNMTTAASSAPLGDAPSSTSASFSESVAPLPKAASPEGSSQKVVPQEFSSVAVAPSEPSPQKVVPTESAPQKAVSPEGSSSVGSIPSSVNLENPAAVQRLWHSVTMALRKANPARGVLFMNAKVSSDTQQTGLLIEFSADNSFAYTAAQKKEVQQLLSQTIEQVAGGSVPYRLTIAGNGKQSSAASRAAYAQSVQARRQPPTSRNVTPKAEVPPAQPVPARSQYHQQADDTVAPVAQNSAFQDDRQSVSSKPEYLGKAAEPVLKNGSGGAGVREQGVSASAGVNQQSAPETQRGASDFVDDQVPLDVYDSYVDPSYSQSSGQYTPEPSVSESAVSKANTAESGTSEPSSSAEELSGGQDEEARIKELLINSFGEGIKFEEIDR